MDLQLRYQNKQYLINNADKIKFLFYLTRACNQKCKYCINKINTSSSNYLKFDELLNRFEEIYIQFKNKFGGSLNVMLYGGEPTINIDNFKKACNIFKKYQIPLTLMTNGFALYSCMDYIPTEYYLAISRDHYNEQKLMSIYNSTHIATNNYIKKCIDKYINSNLKSPDLSLYCLLLKEGISTKEDIINYIETFKNKNIYYLFAEYCGNFNNKNDEYYKNNVIFVDNIVEEIKKDSKFKFLGVYNDDIEYHYQFTYLSDYKIEFIKRKYRIFCDDPNGGKQYFILMPDGSIHRNITTPYLPS